jgi:transcriptional regulator GlxA family with amidase domain
MVEKWRNLGNLAHFHPGELAALAGMSQRSLHRSFQQIFGRSPREWLAQERMRVAQSLLLSGQSGKAVAMDVHFGHPANFSRWFNARKSSESAS